MDESEINNEGKKRLIGTLDPDYSSLPDSKKIKLLQAKGEEEIAERVVKVVDKQLSDAINEKNLEIEEIDERILKTQQYLHTLRYCISLNYYAYGKLKGKPVTKDDEKKKVNHPTVSHLLGQPSTSNESLPTNEALGSFKNENLKQKNGKERESDSTDNGPKLKNEIDEEKSQINPDVNNLDNCRVISQGRLKRLQKKVRVVVGNTYQYLKEAEGPDDQMKFKWHIYVRGPPENRDISNFISSVKFTIDKSYAPHDVITISEPPFYLSRRGWGEFKIYLDLTFIDPRNKPMQLLHPLTLARVDDSLAFTGLWRLGKEMWYDIWLYDKMGPMEPCDNNESPLEQRSPKSIEDLMKEKGFNTETVYSDTDGNVTMVHLPSTEEKASEDTGKDLCTRKLALNGHGLEKVVNGDIVKAEDLKYTEQKDSKNTETKYPIKIENEVDKIVENDIKCNMINSVGRTEKENKANNFISFNKTESSPVVNKVQDKRNKTDHNTNGHKTVDVPLKNSDYVAQKNTANNKTQSSTTNHTVQKISTLDAAQTNATERSATTTPLTQPSSTKLPHFTNGTENEKLCKLLIRQNDGELVTWMVPESMYNMALKFSEKNTKKISANAQTVPQKSDISKTATTSASNNETLKRIVVSAKGVNGIDTPGTAIQPNPGFRIIRPTKITQNNVGQPLLGVPVRTQGMLVKLHPSGKVGVPVSNSSMVVKAGTKVIKVKNENANKSNLNIQNLSLLNTSTNVIGSNSIRLIQPNNTTFIRAPGAVDKNTFNLKGNHISIPTSVLSKGVIAPFLKKDFNYKLVKMDHSNQSVTVPPTTVLASSNHSNDNSVGKNSVPVQLEKLSSDSSLNNGGDSSLNMGPVATRRVFKSTPPHLVKLQESKSCPLKEQERAEPELTNNLELSSQVQVPPLEDYESRRKSLRTQSEHCQSVEEVLRIYMKGLPLFVSHGAESFNWALCAPSYNDFIKYSFGRRRAIEFWRAREIRKELNILKIGNWRDWNTISIASWARKNCYTPVRNASVCNILDKRINRRKMCPIPTSSLTVFSENRCESSSAEEAKILKRTDSNESLIIVDSDDEIDDKATLRPSLQTEGNQNKEEPVLIVPPHTTDGSHFVDLCLSKVRLKMDPEEIEPGIQMDVTKLMLWRVLLSFMEDLTRSAHAEAVSTFQSGSKYVSEKSCAVTVEAKHILAALSRGRPQFQLLSQFGLGKEVFDVDSGKS